VKIRAGRRAVFVAAVVATMVGTLPLEAAAAARKPKAVATPDPRPDAALYAEAQRALATLKATPARQAKRAEWEQVILRFRRVVARYPQSAYCDNALLAVGDLYREMARRFDAPRLKDDAVQAYRALVAGYPSSRLGEKALFSSFEIAREQGGARKDVLDAGRAYLDAFPDSPRAADVKAALRRGSRPTEPSLPLPPPPGLAQVYNLRFWSGDSATRVVFDVEKPVRYKYDRIASPDRLWIDLQGTRLHPNLVGKTFPVGDGLLDRIRVGQNRDGVVRVVLDFKEVRAHNIFYLENPVRLVVDVQGTPRPPSTVIAGRPSPLPGSGVRAADARPSPEPFDLPPDTAPSTRAPQKIPRRRVAGFDPPVTPSSDGRPAPVQIDVPPPPQRPTPEATPLPPGISPPLNTVTAPPPPRSASREEPPPTTAPVVPQVNRAGSYSLARQLGLGARRIVIDAGHGGHDPGSSGRRGLLEKDLVLDVALRLERLVRKELGADVVMTRSTDVFIPLEERTAVANARGADLFLSIHANSSRNPTARGVETYFLNFAQDPHAEAVAARENAISAATLKDLQNLVKAIALNSKIDESRDFALNVQDSMFQNLRAAAPGLPNRGVRTAPFYVLIGANMPSILAEISFVSNPEDERLLKTPDHRERIAQSLLEGVRGYLESLNRTQMRQLTGGSGGSTVATGGSRR
jgi:N-acetylmuramoyl-L-alanine amidase